MPTAYPGPRFGVEGTRRLAGVHERPLIGTIIKPSVGLGPEETASLVRTLCEGGIDFIKDDELQSDGPHCPFDSRVRAVMRVINAHAERTGRKVMYAFNLTGDLDQMRRRHDLLVDEGATCLMVSLNSVGLVGMIELRRSTELPIHAHRNGWGALTRHPLLGWSYVAWQKIWRLAGADHMHVNGLANKFFEDDDSVIRSARECLRPMFPDKPCLAMPVFSSAQTVRQAPGTFAGLGSTDLIMTAGGGIVAHPDGPGAGVPGPAPGVGRCGGRHTARRLCARAPRAGPSARGRGVNSSSASPRWPVDRVLRRRLHWVVGVDGGAGLRRPAHRAVPRPTQPGAPRIVPRIPGHRHRRHRPRPLTRLDG